MCSIFHLNGWQSAYLTSSVTPAVREQRQTRWTVSRSRAIALRFGRHFMIPVVLLRMLPNDYRIMNT